MWKGLLGILLLTFLGVLILSKVFIVHFIMTIALIILTPIVLLSTIVDAIKLLWERIQDRHDRSRT